jgi:hypothetical protein
MTEARRKAKIALLEQRKTFFQVSVEAGLSVATIHNVLDNRSGSLKSKQAITNVIGCQLWDDIPVSGGRISFEAGTIFVFPTLDGAADFADEIKEMGERRDRHVRLSRNLWFTFKIPSDSDQQDPHLAAGCDPRTSEVLEIWSGDVASGSPFLPNDPQEMSTRRAARAHVHSRRKQSKEKFLPKGKT